MEATFIEDVYMTLQGELEVSSAVPGVENLFDEGKPCCTHYEEMLCAYERLCERLGVEDEDADVEILINSLMSITDILAKRMYAYGALFARKSL